jgi:hypothetical protein
VEVENQSEAVIGDVPDHYNHGALINYSPGDIATAHRILKDRDLGVALTGNAEAVEDCPRRVGAVEITA